MFQTPYLSGTSCEASKEELLTELQSPPPNMSALLSDSKWERVNEWLLRTNVVLHRKYFLYPKEDGKINRTKIKLVICYEESYGTKTDLLFNPPPDVILRNVSLDYPAIISNEEFNWSEERRNFGEFKAVYGYSAVLEVLNDQNVLDLLELQDISCILPSAVRKPLSSELFPSLIVYRLCCEGEHVVEISRTEQRIQRHSDSQLTLTLSDGRSISLLEKEGWFLSSSTSAACYSSSFLSSASAVPESETKYSLTTISFGTPVSLNQVESGYGCITCIVKSLLEDQSFYIVTCQHVMKSANSKLGALKQQHTKDDTLQIPSVSFRKANVIARLLNRPITGEHINNLDNEFNKALLCSDITKFTAMFPTVADLRKYCFHGQYLVKFNPQDMIVLDDTIPINFREGVEVEEREGEGAEKIVMSGDVQLIKIPSDKCDELLSQRYENIVLQDVEYGMELTVDYNPVTVHDLVERLSYGTVDVIKTSPHFARCGGRMDRHCHIKDYRFELVKETGEREGIDRKLYNQLLIKRYDSFFGIAGDSGTTVLIKTDEKNCRPAGICWLVQELRRITLYCSLFFEISLLSGRSNETFSH